MHSPVEAAQTAARVGAKRLALTHRIARAAEHYDGDVIIGDDLTTITI